MSVQVFYQVYGMSQPTADTCWLTALTVMVNWRHASSYNPEQVAQAAGYTTQQCDDGASWGPVFQVATHWEVKPPGYTPADVAAWADLMTERGPVWISNASHAVVLHGLEGDGTFEQTMATVTDSWGGVYQKTFGELMEEFGAESGRVVREGGVQIMCF